MACETTADCAGDLVCDCGNSVDGSGNTYCKYAGICRVNHAPVSVKFDVTFPSVNSPGGTQRNPIALWGYDPDGDWLGSFRIVTNPVNGVLHLTGIVGFDAGTTPGLPAPPLPEGTQISGCFPRCLLDRSCPSGSSPGSPEYPYCEGCTGDKCTEGMYWDQVVEYQAFSPDFTGTDSFAYSMIDVFGAEDPPVIVTITVLPG